MINRSLIYWFVCSVVLVTIPLYSLLAQEEEGSSLPPQTVSCFDYYQFGSVEARLTAPVQSTVSGTPIAFSGVIVNKNPYPIVDGSLYVKIMREREVSDANGPDVVDEFYVIDNVTIPAHGTIPVSFEWDIPATAASGNYRMATFFTTSRKFNLLGLTFTDDVVGNSVPFTVIGELSGWVGFDKSSVTMNNDPYYFAAFPPHFETDEPVTVTASVRNTTSSQQVASLQWVVYQWDAQLRENAVQEYTQTVTVPAGGSETVSVTITDNKYPVYLVTGTLVWKDSSSIIGARFARDGVNRARINYPGVLAFPLVAGQENALFSCAHNVGLASSVSDGVLALTIKDRNDAVIHEYTYSGDITSEMMGVASAFTPRQSYDYFTVHALLTQGGQYIDEVTLEYDCAAIDPGTCASTEVSAGSVLTSMQSLAAMALGIAVLLGVLWLYRRTVKPAAPGGEMA